MRVNSEALQGLLHLSLFLIYMDVLNIIRLLSAGLYC